MAAISAWRAAHSLCEGYGPDETATTEAVNAAQAADLERRLLTLKGRE